MKVQSIDTSFISLRQEVKARVSTEKQGAGLAGVGTGPAEQGGEKTVAPDQQKRLDRQRLEEAVEQANKTMETYRTELRFSIHEDSQEMMVEVINTADNSVIREIPPERILNFISHVKKMLGIIIDKFI